MSKVLHDVNDDDDVRAIATPQVFFENSQAKKIIFQCLSNYCVILNFPSDTNNKKKRAMIV